LVVDTGRSLAVGMKDLLALGRFLDGLDVGFRHFVSRYAEGK
jgi:hypothetical protein